MEQRSAKRPKVYVDPATYVFDFGKYNGKKIKDVPVTYIAWCMDNVDWLIFPKPYIKEIQAKATDIKLKQRVFLHFISKMSIWDMIGE